MKTIKNFIIKNYKSIIKVGFGLFIIYWIIFFLTPNVKMSIKDREKIDSLNKIIKDIYTDQKKLDSSISQFTKEVDKIDNNIATIKSQKTIIKEIYHEEINRVSNYNDVQLDSFFANRYGYNSH
jgi:hypothetical protein